MIKALESEEMISLRVEESEREQHVQSLKADMSPLRAAPVWRTHSLSLARPRSCCANSDKWVLESQADLSWNLRCTCVVSASYLTSVSFRFPFCAMGIGGRGSRFRARADR